MSNRSERTFKLLIYESEYRQIQAWTNKHQDIETGGDLFGLWLDERTAVIQLVVGPGKQCRRTSTSFYQDIDYLKRMGDALTLEEGLCHIGEWHSHHRLNIPRPSSGDESTVWSNMDRYGLSRFCLFIANISTTWKWFQLSSVPVDITVNGFLFEVGRRKRRCLPILQAEFTFLHEESPFRSKYLPAIREGAESLNSAEDQLQVVVKKCQLLEMEWEKILQEKQEVEDSLATERHKRREAEKEVERAKQQTYKIQKSLDEQIRVKEETEKSIKYIMQQSQTQSQTAVRYQQRTRELETSLTAEKKARNDLKAALAEEQKAHEETRRNLCNSQQRTHELEMALAAHIQRREETERRLYDSQQRSQELETSLLDKERKARQFTEKRFHDSENEKRLRELEKSLGVERHRRQELEVSLAAKQTAHEQTWINSCNSLDRSQNLEMDLAAQTQAREETERRLQSSQQLSRELQTSLSAHIQRREETETRLYDSLQRSQELETSLAEQSRSREEAEWRYHESEKRSRELENSLTAERQARRELEAFLAEEQKAPTRSRSFGWIVNRDEIALSSVIREEDWGNVVEGSFHDSKVAVKKIHLEYLSRFEADQSFFEREMNIAFECRHPCLLQFFGATYEQRPLFVFELPDTSLGAVIKQQTLEPFEITNIALDVAKGLHYLHTQSPDPIVHGDIRSASVFLWKKGGTAWQAKISDFCTVHLLQQFIKDFPFDNIHVAPEAKDCRSPKVDVYSFGVLLFEMIVRELPDKSRQHQQLGKLPHHYERLIKWCVRQNPEDRPSMMIVIEKIKSFM